MLYMVSTKIKYLWAIEGNDKNSPDFLSLTWSATFVDVNGFKWIIDYGLFQWWKKDLEANNEVFEEVKNLDFIVLTHAHADHCGRLPMLVKNWFSGPIYTTKLTALQTREMLLDNVKIMRSEIDRIRNLNKKNVRNFNDSQFLVNSYEELSSGNLSKEDRTDLKAQIYKKFWDKNMRELEEMYFEAKKSLENKDSKKIFEKQELLFDEVDVEETYSMFRFIDNWEEKIIKQNFSLNSPDLTLDNLLENWYQKSTENIYLGLEVYNKIKLELEEKIKNTKKALDANQKIFDRNQALRKSLEESLDFVENYKEVERTPVYKSHRKNLEENFIDSLWDIDEKMWLYYDIPYSLDELYALNKLLKISFEEEKIEQDTFVEAIKLRFFQAWHIEWSSQVLMSIVSKNSKKISSILSESEIPGFSKKVSKTTNLLFSWDLWRIKNPNLPWSPEKIPYKLDYVQMETTYAWRNHLDREEVEDRFFEELWNFHGKILIPAFSIQRTQELLIMILKEMVNSLDDKESLQEEQENLKKLKSDYEALENKEWHLAKSILKSISFTKKNIFELKKSIIFQNIVVDSPLSIKITDIYRNDENIWNKYRLLDPRRQVEIFWKEVIHFVNWKDEQESIYKWKRKDRKEIIISASGMCDWWSISYHLQKILPNNNAKILFVWYCPESTLWGKIKTQKQVLLDGKAFDVDCKISDLSGFSAHADWEEILTHLKNMNFKRWAKIALTHGWAPREDFSKDVNKIINATSKRIQILVPDLKDEVEIIL